MKKVEELNENELEAASGGVETKKFEQIMRCPRCGKETGRCSMGGFAGNMESMLCSECRNKGVLLK